MTVNPATRPLLASLALSLAAIGLVGCSDEAGDPAISSGDRADSTLADVIGDMGNLTATASALSDTGLQSVFTGPGSYTILAPEDAAFEKLGEDGQILQNEGGKAILVAVLREHIVPGHVTPDSIRQSIRKSGGSVTMRTLGSGSVNFTLDGDTIELTGTDGKKARISGAAVAAGNGVVIPLDSLLAALPGDA